MAAVVLLQILLLQRTSLFFQDSGQIHLKYTLLSFHYRVNNENYILNVLSVRQEHSFFPVLTKACRDTASGSVNQPCSELAGSPLNHHSRTIYWF